METNPFKKARITASISQREAAKKLGIAHTYLSTIENGHQDPSLPLLIKISRLYKTPLATLIQQYEAISLSLATST